MISYAVNTFIGLVTCISGCAPKFTQTMAMVSEGNVHKA